MINANVILFTTTSDFLKLKYNSHNMKESKEPAQVEELMKPRYEIIKDAPKYRVSDHGWIENIKTGKQ